jgi:leucyl aminopeptidase
MLQFHATPLTALTLDVTDAKPLYLVRKENWQDWLQLQPQMLRQWLHASLPQPDTGSCALLPGEQGHVAGAVAIIGNEPDIWSIAHLPSKLPAGKYQLFPYEGISDEMLGMLVAGWALAVYEYRISLKRENAVKHFLVWPELTENQEIRHLLEGIYLVRDLINAPANLMTPKELADAALALAECHHASCSIIVGEELLKAGYPAIYEVGKASVHKPRLIDITWGDPSHPPVTLVGKGVCFDTGGLDIKTSGNMKLMKKDMGGAAHVLGLAHVIMSQHLPVRLRVMVPAVENSVNGNAFRPLDVIETRKGITVEIGNTDAEGRLILSDCLYEADKEKPELLIDCATLTGAARVALGTQLPAFFTDGSLLARELEESARSVADPLWRLPLWPGYRDSLKSKVADICNISSSSFGGAITAALFLKEFVSHTENWVHIDMMAWNVSNLPGRPEGGEAMTLRALYHLIRNRYGQGQAIA